MPGADAIRLGEVGSTQTEARRLAEAGAPEGTLVWAEHQTRGRGRLGRRWLDEPGASLLLSIVLRPRVDPGRLPQLSLVAGVAVAEAIRAECGLPAALQWPNDVTVAGRKAGGILAESFVGPDGAPVVILGIGLNVNQTAMPGELGDRATSLRLEAGRPFDRERLLAALQERLLGWYRRWLAEGFGGVREAWRALSATLGRRVERDGEAGVAVDLGADGALLVRTDAGAVARWVAVEARRGGEHAAHR
jgi:BirA family biotin operon repressor/biotin-[acetyl-CoA-carboxylase] ligase